MSPSTASTVPETPLGVTEAFDALDSSARRDALHAILDRLGKKEWKRVVRTRLEQIRFEFDVVGSLPFEVVIYIAEYLDPGDIIRCQKVCKRWRTMFSNDGVVRPALRQSLASLGLESVDGTVGNAMRYLRWCHGLQFAEPVKKVFLPWQDLRAVKTVSYHSRRLCYSVAGPHNEVEILNLVTGERSNYIDEAAVTPLVDFRISDRVIVMRSKDGSMTAWDLHTIQQYARPSTFPDPWEYKWFAVEKDKVVIYSNLTKNNIWVWDLGSNRIREIGNFYFVWLWHLNADENTLVTFEIDWDNSAEVEQTKWTLTGQLLERKHFHLPLAGHRVKEDMLVRPERGCYRISSHETVIQLLNKIDSHVLHLTYDDTIDQLTPRWIEHDEPIERFMYVGDLAVLNSDIAYGWRRRLRRLVIFDAAKGTTILHPYQSDKEEIDFRGMLKPRAPQSWRWYEFSERKYNESAMPFGDREVSGLSTEDGVQLWFFDPNFTPDIPGARPFLPMEDSG